MNKLPNFPQPKPQTSINNKSLFADNIRTLLTLVHEANLNPDVKFDILDSLTHLAVDQCPKNESEDWKEFRSQVISEFYGDIGKKQIGKGYFCWFKDGNLFINRVNPLPSPAMKSRLISLGFMGSDTKDRTTGLTEYFWRIKFSQVKAKPHLIMREVQRAIENE